MHTKGKAPNILNPTRNIFDNRKEEAKSTAVTICIIVRFQTLFCSDTGSAINKEHIYPLLTESSLFYFLSQNKFHVPRVMFRCYQVPTWRVHLTFAFLLITKFYRKRVMFFPIGFSWYLGINELNDPRSKCCETEGQNRFLKMDLKTPFW